MKTIICVLMLLASGRAAPTNDANNGYDVDNEALLIYSMVSAQRNGGDPSSVLEVMLPSLLRDDFKFSRQTQIDLLSKGGLNTDYATALLSSLMPMLKEEGKSTEEQTMALLLASKQFCTKNKDDQSSCPAEEETVLPLVAMQTERGCQGNDVTISGNVTLAENETCLCKDQSDLMFWVSLFQQFSSKTASSKPDQFPILLMMMLDDSTCTGTLKSTGIDCNCASVTKGHEATLMQYLITSPQLQDLLTEEQRSVVRDAIGTPSLRATTAFNDYLYSVMAGFTSPQVLSLLQNQGQDQQSMIKSLILSSIGLDTSMVQIVLNGGFQDDANKVSMINYLTNAGLLEATYIPFLLGVQNGKDFMLANLVNSGTLDPSMALLLQAMQGGLDQSDLIGISILSMANGQKPGYLDPIGKPYVPDLPKGIYPGSQLYFAHFETLGIDTCSLHDLRSRFDCGYIGISAAECETVPYCCYNPVFLTDIEVGNATNNQITSALAVPWCYYNIFFVYYNSYYMDVKTPGEFAAPMECYGLFKFGIKLEPSLYYLYDPQNPNSGMSKFINFRLECGFPGISEFQCVAVRGCCWDGDAPYRVPQCYKPNGATKYVFDTKKIPAAYMPPKGTCNLNQHQIPLLYYLRVACHYSFDFYISGYNILAMPNEVDCVTKLGCCWESDKSVLETYPKLPQCYQRVGGHHYHAPEGFPSAQTLIGYRSGDSSVASTVQQYAAEKGMPMVRKPEEKS